MAEDNRFLPRRAPIESYGNGGFRFAGMSHQGSLMILGDGMHAWTATDFTGVSPAEVRSAVNDPGFLAGLLDFLMSHEPTLIAFSEATGIAPEAVVNAHSILSGPFGGGDV